MQYRLVLLTHGDAPGLAHVVGSFADNVTPWPTDLMVVHDGPGRLPPVTAMGAWRGLVLPVQSGFCAATAAAWAEAARSGPEFVFWLENDFVFTQQIDLYELATVLEANRHVAQMALYRGAVNDDEWEAGGYLKQHADAYTTRSTEGYIWQETTRNWTTNPSLFRRQIALDHPWPTAPRCEGIFGFDIRDRAPRTTFGIWGDGTPQVEHIGERTGFGY